MILIEEYSPVVFVLSIIVAVLTLPIGVLVPLYLYIKADRGEAGELSTLEIAAILFAGVIGIIAVELGGRTGAIIAIALPFVFILLGVLALAGVALL